MRAMLAIQKQQQLFIHQVFCNQYSISPNGSHTNQLQHMEVPNIEVEDLSTSLIEENDSNTVSVTIDNSSMEELIFYQLQDVIVKLDIQIRLCIRDSLFRLAQSSIQRQHATDTSSRDEVKVLTEDGANQHERMPDVETETNPIDRVVAHLLFHKPLELSQKLPGTPESPLSSKLPYKRKATALMSFPMGFFTEGDKDESSKNIPFLSAERNELKSPRLDTSQNASNNGTADGGAMEPEPSQ